MDEIWIKKYSFWEEFWQSIFCHNFFGWFSKILIFGYFVANLILYPMKLKEIWKINLFKSYRDKTEWMYNEEGGSFIKSFAITFFLFF